MENLDTYHETIQNEWDAVNHGAWAESFQEDCFNEFLGWLGSSGIPQAESSAEHLTSSVGYVARTVEVMLNEAGIKTSFNDSILLNQKIKGLFIEFLSLKLK